MAIQDPDLLNCPVCGRYNERAVAGIRLMNPVGCDEIVLLLRCVGCAASYFEVEESGEAHIEGAEYWTRGPLHPKLAEVAVGQMKGCPGPFQNHQDFCRCLGHRFMANIMYGRLMSRDKEGTPWATEEDLRSRLEWLWTPRLDRALRLAIRVHGSQPRDDGLSYLREHVLPVAVDVADYLRGKVPPFEVERAAAVALLHDVLEDMEWAESPMTDDELRLVPDVVPSRRTAGPLDLAREIAEAGGIEVLTSVIVLTKKGGELLPGLGLLGAQAGPVDMRRASVSSQISPDEADAKADAGQARYIADPWAASYTTRIVKTFDRLNNLQCVHKNPDKVAAYVEETRRDYLPLLDELDRTLARRMNRALDQLQDYVGRQVASRAREPDTHEAPPQGARGSQASSEAGARQEAAEEIRRQLESIAKGASVKVHYHSMAWARRKMGVPEP